MNINFIKLSKINIVLSICLCVLSVISITYNKINLGLEFTSGLEIEIQCNNNIDINFFKKELKDYKNIVIKHYGSQKHIQLKIKKTEKKKDEILKTIQTKIKNNGIILKINYIGAEVNSSIITDSINAIIIAIISMFMYLSYRFNIQLSVSAILTLFHDVLILIGLISFFEIELNLIVMSAIFAVFGYSVNDTVVIFDRIRENIKIYHDRSIENIINISINNTISRTLMTSISTLIVTTILILFCGDHLFYFSIILSIGIIVGTYSSIYISTAILLLTKK